MSPSVRREDAEVVVAVVEVVAVDVLRATVGYAEDIPEVFDEDLPSSESNKTLQ